MSRSYNLTYALNIEKHSYKLYNAIIGIIFFSYLFLLFHVAG